MLARLVDTLPPRDRVGVATIPRGQALSEFTLDRRAVQKALSLASGHKPPPQEQGAIGGLSVNCEAAEGRGVISDLAKMFGALSESPGLKTLVFVSGSMPSVVDPTCAGVREEFVRTAEASGALLVILEPHQFQVDAMVRGRDAWSGFDTMGVSGMTTARALDDLAGAVGGLVYRVTGAGDQLLTNLRSLASARYEFFLELRPGEQSDISEALSVTSTRRGMTLQLSRRGRAQEASGSRETPDEILADARLRTDVPVRVRAFPFRATGSRAIKTVVVAEADTGAVPVADVRMALLDSKRRMVSGWTEVPASAGPTVSASTMPAGRAYARALFLLKDGHVGSAEYEFDAQLEQCGPMALSGIMVGTASEGTFVPALRVGSRAIAYAELYFNQLGVMPPVVTMSVDVGAPERVALAKTRDADRWVLTAPLKESRPPGDHLLEMTVIENGRAICSARTVFRLARHAPLSPASFEDHRLRPVTSQYPRLFPSAASRTSGPMGSHVP